VSNSPEHGEEFKKQIIEQAAHGRFDHCTLLNTPHQVVCERCKNKFSVTYLDYLRDGRFRVGMPKTIDTENPLGGFMAMEEERITPIVFEFTCEHCGNKEEVEPLTVEYLRSIDRSTPTNIRYA